MSRKLILMEQIKRIIQLHADGVSIREIAKRTGMSRNSVKKYLRGCDTSDEKFAEAIEAVIKKQAGSLADAARREELNTHFVYAEKELYKTGVTRELLWTEYRKDYPGGINYSQYCFHFKNYLKHTDAVMHLEYDPGDVIMVDFAGDKLSYLEKHSNERRACEVFVAIFPHSGLIFCRAVHTQQMPDFVICINAMLRYYGGVSKTILGDNMRTAVIRPSRYEPLFTDLCYQLSEHYETTFSATRPYSPRDKAMVESAVKIVYRYIYALLRNQEHHSLEELNQGIAEKLQDLNERLYKNLGCSRWAHFEQHERHLLKALPAEPFYLKKMVWHTVQRNYHIQLTEDKLYYSVPFTYIGKKVKVLYDTRTVEVYHNDARIALHVRATGGKAYTTVQEHMPPNHQYMYEVKGWTKEDLLAKAAKVGQYTSQAVSHMLGNSIYMEQNYKACFGLLMLVRDYNAERLEAACRRVASSSRIYYTLIKTILKNGMDKQPLLFDDKALPDHENIRGAEHYQ